MTSKYIDNSPLDEIVNSINELEIAFALFDGNDRLVFCNHQFRHAHHAIASLFENTIIWSVFQREAERSGTGNGLKQIDAHIRSSHEEVLSIEVSRPNGKWIRLRMQPLHDGSFIITETDITEAMVATELQAEAESLLRRVLNASGTNILMSRLDDSKIVYRTQAHKEFIGEIDKADDMYPDQNDRSDFLADILSSRSLDGFEIQMLKADGNKFPARVTGKLIKYEGEEVIVTSFIDMTQHYAQRDEIVRQREISLQNEKLTALGEVLAGVAHELNNPLSVVTGQSLMLKEEALSESAAYRVDKISKSAERCTKIIKTFLALARQKPIKLESISINEVIETALDVSSYSLQMTGAQISINLAKNIPNILADEDQLTQVFINLIVNAEHALENIQNDAKVSIMTRYDEVSDMIIAEIEDNGPGIPYELQARIFEPFYTTKKVGKGTGIGLALSHRIVTTHNGFLEVDSDSSGGAKFSIKLPSTKIARNKYNNTPQQNMPSRLTALVVDDEKDVAETLCDMLQNIGIAATYVNSAEHTLELLSLGKTYNIIFSDLKMPGISGLELFDMINTKWPKSAQSFIFITGDSMSNSADKIRRNNHAHLLEKPISPNELQKIITEITGASSYDL